VNQRYTLSWSPGTRLAGTLYYQDTDDDRGSRITSSGAGLNYKINPQFTMFANTSFSRTDTGPLSRRKVVNMLAGLTLNF